MKKMLCYMFFCITILITQTALADIAIMHLNGTISDTTGISLVKLYYADNNNMTNKILHLESTNSIEESQGTFSMTCTNVPINTYPAFIQIAAEFTDGTEVNSNVQEIAEDPAKPYTLSQVQNLRIVSSSSPPQDDGVFYWGMNTLPTTTTTSEKGNITITKHQNDGTSSPGVEGNCLEQTGTWQAYRFPMTIVPAAKGKISFWAKHSNPPDTGDLTRYFFISTNRGEANTICAYTYKGNLYFYVYDSSGAYHRTLKVADTWQTGVWYQYEFIWDGYVGTMAIKRDGAIVSESSSTPWNSAIPDWGNKDFYIGYSDPLGSIDEFTIFDN